MYLNPATLERELFVLHIEANYLVQLLFLLAFNYLNILCLLTAIFIVFCSTILGETVTVGREKKYTPTNKNIQTKGKEKRGLTKTLLHPLKNRKLIQILI